MSKVIVITGATSGFGLAMAEKFARSGCSLALVARGKEKLTELVKKVEKLGGKAIAISADVTKSGAFDSVLAETVKKFGRIDVLINNAGGGVKIGPIEDMDEASVRQILDLNLTSVINSCRAIVPQMKKQKGGLVINLTSACAKFAWPQWSVYSASKAGLSMFSRCLHAELRPFNIAVSVIVPGGSNTGFQKNAGINNFGWNEENALRPEHIAEAAHGIVFMSKGAAVPEIVVYGMEQDVVPF
ncbi:MAG: SDR family oxidoreductase [Victivallales bacterium]